MSLKQFNPQKIWYHIPRIKSWMDGKLVYPVTVEVDPSNVCNHSCIWCTFLELQKDRAKTLTREVLLKLLIDFKRLDVKAVTWTGGGEPFVNKNLIDAIRLAKELGIDMGLTTNGVLMDDKLCELVVDSHIWVRISLDASNRETYARTHRCKREDFDKAINNLKTLCRLKKEKGKNVTIGVGYLVHPTNVDGIVEAAKIAADADVDYFQVRPAILHKGKQFGRELWEKAISLTEEAKRFERPGFDIIAITHKFKDILGAERINYGRQYAECLSHHFMTTIGADGTVWLCCHLRGYPEFSLGNLYEKGFEEIWKGEERKKVIKRIDMSRCQPICRNHEQNKNLWLIKSKGQHADFL